MGLFSGSRPDGLGVNNGQLKTAPGKPNCVNSQSLEGYSTIAPFNYSGDGRPAQARIKSVVEATPVAKIIESRPDYFYAEYTSRMLRFVDDVEFYLDEKAGVIQVRSASLLGKKDFGVNRKRVEEIRAAFSKPTS